MPLFFHIFNAIYWSRTLFFFYLMKFYLRFNAIFILLACIWNIEWICWEKIPILHFWLIKIYFVSNTGWTLKGKTFDSFLLQLVLSKTVIWNYINSNILVVYIIGDDFNNYYKLTQFWVEKSIVVSFWNSDFHKLRNTGFQ